MQSESKLLIETFIDSLWLEKNLSQNTLSSYKTDLDKFKNFLEKNETVSYTHLTLPTTTSV